MLQYELPISTLVFPETQVATPTLFMKQIVRTDVPGIAALGIVLLWKLAEWGVGQVTRLVCVQVDGRLSTRPRQAGWLARDEARGCVDGERSSRLGPDSGDGAAASHGGDNAY